MFFNKNTSGKIKGLLALPIFLLSLMIYSCQSNNGKEQYGDDQSVPLLHERKGEMAQTAEWQKTRLKVAELTGKINESPADVKPRLQLAMIYMSEARITGDAYYYDATWRLLDGVERIQPKNFEAATFKASLAMSLHRFAEAKQLAEKAKNINPDNAYVYGVLVDANVELGNYPEAIAMSDKMQVLKPSLESYARASYLREIHGDYAGAIQAMTLAVQAGAPGTESAEWARVALGDLYLNTGKTDSAGMQYDMALTMRKDFPTALIGLAKVDKANKNYDAGIQHTEQAIRIMSESAYISFLGELYELKGDKTKAAEIRSDVVNLLEESEKTKPVHIPFVHNANRELANAYLAQGNLDKAISFANNDLELRPQNIDANELVAWIAYQKGDIITAKKHADKMLATNTQNANTLYKASLIYAKAGDTQKGNMLAQKARSVNPYIDQKLLLASK